MRGQETGRLFKRVSAPLVARQHLIDADGSGPTQRLPLGEILLVQGVLREFDLARALALQTQHQARLGDILLANGMVSDDALMAALALQWGAGVVDVLSDPPDPRLIDGMGIEFCLKNGLLPWRRVGGAVVVVTSRPDCFDNLRADLVAHLGPVVMGLASEPDLHRAVLNTRQAALNHAAETCVPLNVSCRGFRSDRLQEAAVVLAGALAVLAAVAPQVFVGLLLGWAVLSLCASMALKLATAVAAQSRPRLSALTPPPIGRLPVVSVMVPLFHETDIAARLVARLGQLRYPRELLDIVLVVEQEDSATHAALQSADLPRWMRIVTVPNGPLKTKPRALNFALNFCRGTIIGVYDAEDAPAPDQILRVVERFAVAPANVACLQGVLDFYNARHNWLARCFTVEYALSFRVILPGLQRLGLVLPLGGTTLFFRREVLQKLGGWDAYNVTEDADLGVRLARCGYRTEMIDTVTEEEANCRAWPWVRQRSRWLKGYAMTYGVHMRDPRQLLRDLGAWRFLGFQIVFLGAMSQFLLAPLLWSFWLITFGLWHPSEDLLSYHAIFVLGGLFVFAEAVNIAVGLVAVWGAKHRHLWLWVPSLHVYFMLGAIAAAKAAWEMLHQPFFWDKTSHGHSDTHVSASMVQNTGLVAAPLLISPTPPRV